MFRQRIRIFLAVVVLPSMLNVVHAEDAVEAAEKTKETRSAKMVDMTLRNGALKLKVDATWKKPAKKRSSILEAEFAVPPAKDDPAPGRLTMMRSGGSIKQNVERWFGQFIQPDGKATKEVAKVTEKKANGQKVTIVDITGTFKESTGGGPFAPGKIVSRKDYRMLGGIVQTKFGQYFFKLYGPKKTVAKAEKSFDAMIDSVAPSSP